MVKGLDELELHRLQYEQSIHAVADSMKHCVQMAEAFAHAVHQVTFSSDAIVINGVDAGGKRKRVTKPKDPNAPKRPASAYIIFQNEIRSELKQKNPNMDNKELLSTIAKMWQDMSEQDKQSYHNQVALDKERYQAELAAYGARSPEQVAADDAATAAAVEAKKAGRRTKSKPAAAASPVEKPLQKTKKSKAPIPPVKAASTDYSEEEGSEEEEMEEEKPAKKPVSKSSKRHPAATSSSSEEEESDDSEEEEDDEARPFKKSRR